MFFVVYDIYLLVVLVRVYLLFLYQTSAKS